MRNKLLVSGIGIALVLALILPLVVLAQGGQPPIPPSPQSGDYVLDSLGWLSEAQEAEINSVVAKLDTEGLAEIAVVTLDDCGEDKQMFRNDLFRSWGIGHADDNDGLLIMVCWYGGDKSRRSLEQEVGYGMEGTIPDLLTSKVAQQYFVTAFKSSSDPVGSGKAGEALVAMVKAYDSVIRGETPAELQEAQGSIPLWIVLVVLVVLILLIAVLAAWVGGSGSGGYYSGSSSSSSSSSDGGGPSFGGGDSGGGGSSTGF